jgi:peptide methionine sulfoxide reductase msrA/msrB
MKTKLLFSGYVIKRFIMITFRSKFILTFILTIVFKLLAAQEIMKFNMLTPDEERVILNKGTEMPFSGKYNKHYEKGTYTCKRCDAPLYFSDDKFDSGCGWPSFDHEIPGAVKRIPDADGHRTEIVCANCGGHLGHVFLGEGFTEKNTRHCVNSISMNFVPEKKEQEIELETAIFASGCFWGTEYYLKKPLGVKSTEVGYIGGHVEHPTYEQVCTGRTGHAEAVKVVFDPSVVSYEELTRLFFETHDFTQINRQGPDIGEQYRSVVFYTNEKQKQIAEKLIGILTDKGYKVATKVEKATDFYTAETYHQDYYFKTGGVPYCHFKRKVF